MRPSALIFEYDDFPPVPREEWQGSELRHALVLARVVAAFLVASGFTVEEPIQEDFGAVLRASSSEGQTDISVSFYPRDSSDFTWAVQFRARRGLIRRMFGKGGDELIAGPVKEAIAAAVAGEPTRFRLVTWLEPSKL
jgi:hypothetical protein